MKQNILFIVFLFVVMTTNGQTEQKIPTPEQLAARKENLTTNQRSMLQKDMDFFSEQSLKKLKAFFKKKLAQSETNKEKYSAMLKSGYLSRNKFYTPEEEELDLFPTVRLNFQEKDSLYIDYLKQGLLFGQHFREDTNSVYIMLDADIDGMSSFSLGSGKNLHPYRSSSNNSFSSIYLKKVFYSNGETEENLHPEWCYFLNSYCAIGRKIPIDSMWVHYSISTICQYDSITFYPEDLNVAKEGYRVTNFENNYFACTGKKLGYWDFIIDEKAYNKENKAIDIDQSFSDYSQFACDSGYYQWREELQSLIADITPIATKEEILLFLEYKLAASYLSEEPTYFQNHYLYEGNIAKMVIYIEKKRCITDFDVLFRSGMGNQNLFTNSFKEETFLINKKGETVMRFPIGKLEFISSKDDFIDRGIENTHYLTNYPDYYHLDYATKKLRKLEKLKNISPLSADLVSAWDNEKQAVTILNNQVNRITDTLFSRVKINGNLLVAEFNRFEKILMDTKGKRILSEPIFNICSHYKDLYRVTININQWQKKTGFINSKGQWILAPDYEYSGQYYDRRDPNFKSELQIIEKDGLYGLFSVENGGELSFPCQFTSIIPLAQSDGQQYIVEQDSLFGIIEIDKGFLYPCKFTLEEIQSF